MLLELLLEEAELSEAAMEALQRTYNLQSRDAEVNSTFLFISCVLLLLLFALCTLL